MKASCLPICIALFSFIFAQNPLPAQNEDAAGINILLYQTLLPVNKKPTRLITDYFQKGGELVDVSGNLIVGRTAISNWYKIQKAACPGYQPETFKRLSKHTRYLDPALRVKIIQSKVSIDGRDVFATCTYFARRIDNKWYVESCSVVQTLTPPAN